MNEKRCPWSGFEARLAILEGGIKHWQGTNVQPPATNQWENSNFYYRQQRYLHDNVAQAQDPSTLSHSKHLGQGMQFYESYPDDAVAQECRQQPMEMHLRLSGLQDSQQEDGHVANGVGAKGEYEDEEGVERNHPENMLKKYLAKMYWREC